MCRDLPGYVHLSEPMRQASGLRSLVSFLTQLGYPPWVFLMSFYIRAPCQPDSPHETVNLGLAFPLLLKWLLQSWTLTLVLLKFWTVPVKKNRHKQSQTVKTKINTFIQSKYINVHPQASRTTRELWPHQADITRCQWQTLKWWRSIISQEFRIAC